MGVTFQNGVELHNFYVPAGGDIPDREVNPKFGQKLDFVERMTRWSETVDRPTLLLGDFNVAPLPSDVYDHKALLKVVSHTPREVETLQRLGFAQASEVSATIRGWHFGRYAATRSARSREFHGDAPADAAEAFPIVVGMCEQAPPIRRPRSFLAAPAVAAGRRSSQR